MAGLRMHRHGLTMSKLALATRTTATERLSGGAWDTVRTRIMTRDEGTCRCAECRAAGRLLEAHEVDHIVPVEQGGGHHDGNLQAINRDCHKAKTASEARARARAIPRN